MPTLSKLARERQQSRSPPFWVSECISKGSALKLMHAQMEQRQRLKNFDRFKANDRAIIVATDVVGRGTDVPEVKYVIHYQFPRCVFAHPEKPAFPAKNPILFHRFYALDVMQFFLQKQDFNAFFISNNYQNYCFHTAQLAPTGGPRNSYPPN